MSKKSSSAFAKRDYIRALKLVTLAPHEIRMLQFNYHAPDRSITTTQMAKRMGWRGKSANRHYGGLAKKIGIALGWKPLPAQYVYVLVTFEKPEKEWLWILRPEIAAAMEELGLLGETQDSVTEETDSPESLYEGAVTTITVNAYERSVEAREKCLLHHGCKCSACGILLSDVYGEIAEGFIHVHHLKPLAEVRASCQVDPIRDMVPVCPTCHAIIHLRKPPFSIHEVKSLIK